MCYEYESLEWLQRAEQFRKEMERELKEQRNPAAPASPEAPDTGRKPEPVPV